MLDLCTVASRRQAGECCHGADRGALVGPHGDRDYFWLAILEFYPARNVLILLSVACTWKRLESIGGAGNRIRTYDPRITNALLYQLSYPGAGRRIL